VGSPSRLALRTATAILVGLVAGAAPAQAQLRVDAGTQVRSIRFEGARALPEARLRAELETRDRGAAHGLRTLLGKLPLVGPPAARPFSPLGLQRDVVRLRNLYRDEGFLGASVRYEARLDPGHNLLDITFHIEEGAATRVVGAAIVGPDSVSRLEAPEPYRSQWRRLEASVERLRGRRLAMPRIHARTRAIVRWWQDHGHPSAELHGIFDVDSARNEARLRFAVATGPSARFGTISVAGVSTISEHTVRRELPFREGDPFSVSSLAEARSGLQQLEIIRSATFQVGDPDSGAALAPTSGRELPVRVDILEARPHHFGGGVGYGSDAGISADTRWGHRNFTGAGRSLTASVAAQTGVLALADNPDERYRASLSLLQPYVLDRRLSAVVSPFVEHRDDDRDRSFESGTNATLILRASADRVATLDYRYGHRHVYEYRFGGLASGETDLLTLLTLFSQGILDSLGTTLNSSLLTLSGRLGTLDQPVNPRRGWLLRPTVQVTAPPGISSTTYWRLDGTANGFLPISRWAVLVGRLGAGRVYPFGKSLPSAADEGTIKFLRLRDALETAGGSGDVRGWGPRLLGPKFPDLRLREVDGRVTLDAAGYVPLGGFERMTFSSELRLPLPGFGRGIGTFVFLDGGRVWTDDARFVGNDAEPDDQQRWFYATGGGLDIRTPVGPVRLGVGYKLNPSITDLADANDYTRALIDGTPVSQVPRRNSRRWQLHFSFGSAY